MGPDMDAPSVCESNPSESKASAKAGTNTSQVPEGPSVCESTPAQSSATITAADAVPLVVEGPVVCESNPTESTAHVKSTGAVSNEVDPNATSVFENKPRLSLATCTHNDMVQGIVDAPSVFESQPESRKTDAAHNAAAVESGSEWETDYSEEG